MSAATREGRRQASRTRIAQRSIEDMPDPDLRNSLIMAETDEYRPWIQRGNESRAAWNLEPVKESATAVVDQETAAPAQSQGRHPKGWSGSTNEGERERERYGRRLEGNKDGSQTEKMQRDVEEHHTHRATWLGSSSQATQTCRLSSI